MNHKLPPSMASFSLMVHEYLDACYAEMATDYEREREAAEWTEAFSGGENHEHW